MNIINFFLITLKTENDLIYFGPYSNKPGNHTNSIQLGFPENISPIECTFNNKLHNINGFFMVFTKNVLLKNKYNNIYYFNPKYPFGGNETEWFKRFIKIGGKGMIVPKTYIYHYKLARWRHNNLLKNNNCIYTINLGNYEKSKIYLNNDIGYDCIYYTDNYLNIYNCIKQNIIPFYICTKNKESKLIQRIIKTSPHLYLPYQYNKSLYIDGNMQLKNNNITKKKLKIYFNLNYDVICFKHPVRNNIFQEAYMVHILKLEKKENINKILNILKQNNFNNIGLTETNVIIREHKKIINFNNEWTQLINICRRDQLSFDYLLYKYNINYKRYNYEDKLKFINKHKHLNPINRYIN